jgi:hypothetical protein
MNPYASSHQDCPVTQSRRGVRRYAAIASLLLLISLLVATPGFFLLNQNLQVFPTSTTADRFVINDEPVETTTVTMYLLGTAAVLVVLSILLLLLALSNRRKNLAYLIDTQKASGERYDAPESPSRAF